MDTRIRLIFSIFFVFLFGACSSAPVIEKEQAPVETSAIPQSYREIKYPEFVYVAPFPADYRVKISDSITGYIIEDRTLPLVHFSVYFRESRLADSLKNEAAYELLSPMFRRGGSVKLGPQALDDSLEFIGASVSGSLGTFRSFIGVECLSKNFPQMLSLVKDVFLLPAFDEKELEIQKAAAINAYEHRYDTPSAVLSSLYQYVNYEPNPRLWDATGEEFKNVTRDDLLKISKNHFLSHRIVFAIAGDFDKDSMTAVLRSYFASWNAADSVNSAVPQPLKLKKRPGIYLVDRDISQANISMCAPFVKRPDPDYYPTALASFVLGGGSFSSRLMTRVRSDNGLAYSIHSSVDNNYHDQGLVTISLQTKVESASLALGLIKEEINKLAKEGPTDEELALAKKALIESLPSLFDSPANTTLIFADGELLGKKDTHYIDYVNEINAVTKDQIKAMISKYFDPQKMTVSIVGPASKLSSIGKFTLVPLDSLDFRK
ncbi:MAG: insulinase family protein [Fibrobacteraceae bacterium]|nr:insulinase family protein [Fibrobacteraceae bacterium]